MVSADCVYNQLEKTKQKIRERIKKKDYNNALTLISMCANLLYQTNIYYCDEELENSLKIIADEMGIRSSSTNDQYISNESILFFDGFGLNDRGLIRIYLKALCRIRKVVYVTYEDRKESIPDVLSILNQYGCETRYLDRKKNNVRLIERLKSIVNEMRPGIMFYYSVPNDVVATPLMYAYEGVIKRFQINLTDHAFWLGAHCIDKCIEFRNYGACISKEYRKIDEEKLVIVPFYPIFKNNMEFQGYPFEKGKSQKVVFSGGALYKTMSEDNKYYEIVDYILSKHEDTIFWYAGTGDDSKMRKIIKKYPKRAFLTAERSDLYRVLEKCDVYLSTYPVCGGLMFQYAAIAGRVPVTLKSGRISDGFLVDQESINVEFNDLQLLYNEIDRLLDDSKYAKDRSELMKKSVISADCFEEEVRRLVNGDGDSSYPIRYEHIDTKDFRSWYLDNMDKIDIDATFVNKRYIKYGATHFPIRFFRGGVRLLKRRFL